jgi:hypothetical protein
MADPTPVQPLLHFQPFANIFTVVDEYTTSLGPLATLQGTKPTAATSSQAGIVASISSSAAAAAAAVMAAAAAAAAAVASSWKLPLIK